MPLLVSGAVRPVHAVCVGALSCLLALAGPARSAPPVLSAAAQELVAEQGRAVLLDVETVTETARADLEDLLAGVEPVGPADLAGEVRALAGEIRESQEEARSESRDFVSLLAPAEARRLGIPPARAEELLREALRAATRAEAGPAREALDRLVKATEATGGPRGKPAHEVQEALRDLSRAVQSMARFLDGMPL